MPAELHVAMPNVWSEVRGLRQRIGELVATPPDDLRRATQMVASELLENAIKYGEPVPGCPEIRFSLRLHEDRIVLQVSNGVRSPEVLERLRTGIGDLAAPNDPGTVYRRRLEQMLSAPGTRGQLGLVRICFEGGFTLEASLSGEILTVTAARALEST
jgi:hypothetical protein